MSGVLMLFPLRNSLVRKTSQGFLGSRFKRLSKSVKNAGRKHGKHIFFGYGSPEVPAAPESPLRLEAPRRSLELHEPSQGGVGFATPKENATQTPTVRSCAEYSPLLECRSKRRRAGKFCGRVERTPSAGPLPPRGGHPSTWYAEA